MYSDSMNPYGLLNGRLVSVNDVPSGLSCGCLCPKCKEPLVAKKGRVKSHHFSHYIQSNCSGSLETALHIKSKEIFLKHKHIMLPPGLGKVRVRRVRKIPDAIYKSLMLDSQYQVDYYYQDGNINKIEYDDVFIETNIGKIKPDVILSSKDPFIVELYVTHKTDFNKIRAIKNMRLPAIEIDLRYLRGLDLLDEKLIENAVINCTHTKKWLSLPGV